MNMNFIAFSSQAKLLDRPHLDAAAVGHRLLDAGVRLLPEHHVHVVLDKIYQADALDNPPAAGEWLRTPACRSEGAEIDNRDGYARQSADSARDYLRAARLKIDYRVMWRGVPARAQRCAQKARSPTRPRGRP